MNLRDHRFFSGFCSSDAAKLEEVAKIEEFPAQSSIFQEGAESNAVYLILSGKVEMFKKAEGIEPRLIASAREGDYFGEMGVLDGSVRSTTAIATEDTTIGRIPKEVFVQTLKDAPGSTALSFIHQVLDQLRAINDRYITDVVKKEKLSLVGEMANTIIHDIRGPFTSVQLGTDLISEKYDDVETREICEMMKGQIGRVKGMAEELLEFSRGTSSIRLEEIELSELISQFHFLNRDFIASTNVKLDLSHANVRLKADAMKLMRVLQNLLNNSIEALKGRSDAHVTITAGPEAGLAEVRISDNGLGIPEQIRDRLFEPFVTHGKKNGTGLGMAITKSIVVAHQGTIHFETETGKGTTFIVRIPALT